MRPDMPRWYITGIFICPGCNRRVEGAKIFNATVYDTCPGCGKYALRDFKREPK